MKALVVAPEPFFTPRGTPFSVYYRALVMAEQGVEIDLLTYGEGVDVDIPGLRILRIPRLRPLGSVRIGPSFLKAFLDVMLFLRLGTLLARNRYAFVHAHEEGVFLCLPLRRLRRFKLLYDMHSSLPQQLINFQFTNSRLLIGLFRRLEASALRRADAVLTVSPALAEHAIERMPDPARHFLIENTIFEGVRVADGKALALEPSDGESETESPFAEVPTDRPLVVYAGTFEPYQGLHLLVPAFARVRARQPEAFLLMMGGTRKQVALYRELASRHGLDGHCWVMERVEQSVAREYIQRASVVVSPRSEGTNTPLKLYELLASGIPLVATRVPSHTQILDDSICFLVDPNEEALGLGILEALDDTERRVDVVRAATARHQQLYSRSAYEAKIRLVLELLQT